jgi:geranylgeranyl pyrophosphate synthase
MRGDLAGTSRQVLFHDMYRAHKNDIDHFLDAYLPVFEADGQKLLGEAMRYCVVGGGKRIRGALSLAVGDMFGGDRRASLTLAGAIEYIHAYSLVHDDMPCMDDDDFRRGKPSCHKAFGEDVALLAGDALLNLAFEILLDYAAKTKEAPETRQGRGFLAAAAHISCAAGARGMAGGQAMDLRADIGGETQLNYLHRLKTGCLFRASVLAPAICFGADEEEYAALDAFGDAFGLAFQIGDDLADSNKAGLGDTKQDYATLLGEASAKLRFIETCDNAIAHLSSFSDRADFLRGAVRFIYSESF